MQLLSRGTVVRKHSWESQLDPFFLQVKRKHILAVNNILTRTNPEFLLFHHYKLKSGGRGSQQFCWSSVEFTDMFFRFSGFDRSAPSEEGRL